MGPNKPCGLNMKLNDEFLLEQDNYNFILIKLTDSCSRGKKECPEDVFICDGCNERFDEEELEELYPDADKYYCQACMDTAIEENNGNINNKKR